MSNLRFESVTTREQFDKMRDFAKSFNHVIDDSTLLPLIMVSREDKLFAYYTLITHPIVVPAFHPEFTTKRDFIDAVQSVKNHHFLSSMSERFPNGTFFTMLPMDLSEEKKSLAGRMDIKPITPRAELYQAIPGGII